LVTAEITAMLPTPVAKISGKCETAIHEHFKIKESIDGILGKDFVTYTLIKK